MPADDTLVVQWDVFLKLLQVREPKFYEHLKKSRLKEKTKYNLIVIAPTKEELQKVEVGLRVYAEQLPVFTEAVFGCSLGIKPQLGENEDFQEAPPDKSNAGAAQASQGSSVDQAELLKILEAGLRQKLEKEIREQLTAEAASGTLREELERQIAENLEQEEQNRRLAVRVTLIAEGDRLIHQAVLAWQQAKQTGEGGAAWMEVRQCLLQLLDVTVQLGHS